MEEKENWLEDGLFEKGSELLDDNSDGVCLEVET
jgi:hypothetical protein